MINRLKVQDFKPYSTACDSETNDCLYFQIANPPKTKKLYKTQVADSLASLRKLNRELEEKNKDLKDRFNSITWGYLQRGSQADRKLFHQNNQSKGDSQEKEKPTKGTRLAQQVKQIGSTINTVPCVLNIRKVLKNKRESCLRAASSATQNRTYASASCSSQRKDESCKQGSSRERGKQETAATKMTSLSNQSTSKSRYRYHQPLDNINNGKINYYATSSASNSRLAKHAVDSRLQCFPKSRRHPSIRK